MEHRLCNQQMKHSDHHQNMKKTVIVVLITLFTMFAEIVYGLITGSMALLADGIHMGTHTFALIITVIAYYIAQKHADNPNFAFSSGKVGVLGGFTNAIILGITALYMVYEAIQRLLHPESIIFSQALTVAFIGLAVNIISAFLLASGGHDHHHHGHSHDHHHDHNLRAAYLHVITDAMTSVLAIVALLIGQFFDYTWPDAVVAILGALVILKWAYGLLVSSGSLLVDYHPVADDYKIISALAEEIDANVSDLHVWQTSDTHKAIILKLLVNNSDKADNIGNRIKKECNCQHLPLEIEYNS